MMLNSRLFSGPHIPAKDDPVLGGRASLPGSNKRRRGSKSSRKGGNDNDKKLRSDKSDPGQGAPEDSSTSFACPFYKWDAETYGGKGGCSSWGNKSLESLIRYHILDKHRKANLARIANGEARYLDDARFEEVEKFKRMKSSGDSKEEQAENKWKALYMLLFDIGADAKNNVPDPYFKPKAKSNALGFSLEDLERMILDRSTDRPSIIPESADFIREIARLENEQARQKEKVQIAAAARQSQLKTQIRDIKELRALQEQKIDAYYNDQINSVRSQYMAIISPSPELPSQPYHEPPPLPLFDFDAEFDLELSGVVLAPSSEASAEDSTHAQSGIFAESAAGTLEQDDLTASSRTSLPSQWSSNPSHSMNPCGLCPTKRHDESMWCEGCRSLTNLAVL
jgi:hypothetical protein